ncbi:uncharacterized protein JCM15063_002834 [Sporobolomyces koalae]|uniref:uncharacterized protein n=1 Tax=Sporobolomyces koalae TaxID=500713 RepID=UPI00317919F5
MSGFQSSHQHSLSQSSSSSHSLLPANAPSPYLNSANQTRILLLSDFDPSLKTRDLMDLLSEWEDDRGGFKVKWRDDTSAWAVFNDAAVAKRAFLSLLTKPPKALLPQSSNKMHPSISAYTGPDVSQILQAVQHRPRSHSNAGMSHHSRKGSLAGSGGGTLLGGANVLGNNNNNGSNSTMGGTSQQPHHHSRTASWGRNSIDRRTAMRDLIAETSTSSTGLHSSGLPSSPFDGRSSPETFSQGHGGIVAGDTPRRIGQPAGAATLNHRRTGSESLASRSLPGSTIRSNSQS